ncbi:MAG: type II toxin-antitoxin system VapC family toxin [Actinomycetota bacterium]|nr:type II toxin-antitoxin system VapC family toxin [Actinomycetota bacterium]
MRLLLDTSTLLWWLDGNAKLGPSARAAIADPDNEVFVSSASAWEISVKRASGKLESPFDVASALERNHLTDLPVEVDHAVAAGELPRHHKDPFDRMLVAQAQLEQLTLVTADVQIADYEVELLDASM